MEILYEDNHLLVVNKPADWIVQGAGPDRASLLEWGKDYLKSKYSKPGNVFLGAVSRLDAPVTGVVPLARTSKAASRLSQQLRDQSWTKVYWAIVEGALQKQESRLENWLVRDESAAITRVVGAQVPGAQNAILEYKTLKVVGNLSWLEVQLITGRKHQIRAQLSALRHPIVGDRKYDSLRPFAEGIALHCRSIVFQHPTRDETLSLEADVPNCWKPLGFAT
jgi:23S rRNA pseudouridine1911/1915/1917 synthase